jgi:hypothetical protein
VEVDRVLRKHQHLSAACNVVEDGLFRPHGYCSARSVPDEGVGVFARLPHDFCDRGARFGGGKRRCLLQSLLFLLTLVFVQSVHPIFDVAIRMAVEAAHRVLHVFFKLFEQREVPGQPLERLDVQVAAQLFNAAARPHDMLRQRRGSESLVWLAARIDDTGEHADGGLKAGLVYLHVLPLQQLTELIRVAELLVNDVALVECRLDARLHPVQSPGEFASAQLDVCEYMRGGQRDLAQLHQDARALSNHSVLVTLHRADRSATDAGGIECVRDVAI